MFRMAVLTLTLAVVALSGPATAEPTHAERAACQVDAFKFCQHAIPDRDQVRACLRQNVRRLNGTCRGAIQRSRK
jgi:hypothetical protein